MADRFTSTRAPGGAVAASAAVALWTNGAPGSNGGAAPNGAHGVSAPDGAHAANGHPVGNGAAAPARPWTALPGDDGRLARAERAWRERFEALERELSGSALALASAHADLRAVRAARAADASALEVLRAQLEAERIAHAVARGTAARLAADLARARAELAAAQGPRRPDIHRRAQAQADAAKARPAADAGRLLADLDAAAVALRRDAPAEPERRLRTALVALARQDPLAAGRLLIALLPAQGAALEGPLAYDLTVRGLGTFAVSIDAGRSDVRRLRKPRRRSEAAFHLRAEPLALAELLAGEPTRIGRFRGKARATGRRARTAELAPLAATDASLAAAVRAGARLEPGLVYALLPFAVEPEWTRGHAFTVGQEIGDRTWFVTARDGAPLHVSEHSPVKQPDAAVTLTKAAFAAILRDEPPPPGELPAVRGDRAAVTALKGWTDRARY